MSITGINAGQAVVQIIGDNSKLKDALDTAGAGIQGFAQRWTAIGARLQAAGQMMFAPFQEAMRVFADFDDQMRRVAAVSGATGQAFTMLTKQAKELGASTAFTASQVAAGMASLGMMGFSPDEISGAMESVMALSRATSTDLAEAASIAANQLRVFGLSAADTGKVADILAATANGSAQTLTDLGEALKMAGPLAKVTGQDLKQVSAALGVLANMGIRGSMAGTAIARSYKQMAIPKVQDHLRGLGVEVLDVNGNLRNMAEIWADLGKKLATMTNADQLATLKEVFNERGILGGGVLSFNPQAIDDFMAKLKQCDGYVSDAAETMEGGLGGALRNLSSAWEAVKIAAGEAASALAPVVKILATLARAFAAVIRWTGPLVPILTALTAVLTAVGGAMSAAGVLASMWSLGFSKLGSAVMLLGKGLGWLTDMVLVYGTRLAATIAVQYSNIAACYAQVGALGTLKAAWHALTAAMLANPWAALATAVVASLVAIGAVFTKQINHATRLAVGTSERLRGNLNDEGVRDDADQEMSTDERLARARERFVKRQEQVKKLREQWSSRPWKLLPFNKGTAYLEEINQLQKEQDAEIRRILDLEKQQAKEFPMPGVSQTMLDRQNEIEKQLADERLTQTEKEIKANEELRKELLEVYEAQLKVAEAKGATAAAEGIRKQIADTNKRFDARRADIVAKEAKSAGIVDIAADQRKRSEARAKATAEARQERQLEALRDSSPAAYQAKLQQLITEATDAVSIAAKALADEQSQATLAGSEGGEGITNAEKAAIDAQRELYEEAQKHLDKLQGKLDNAETNSQKLAMQVASSVGAFSTRQLAQMVGSTSSAEKTAQNTLATVQVLKRIYDRVTPRKDSETNLTYA